MKDSGQNANSQDARDAAQLASFGYQQQLSRVLNVWTNFSVGFTYLSPVVGVYALFGYGLATGGPAFIWSVPLVALGQGFVALTFAEVSSHYPIAGGIYQWNRRLVGPNYAWFAAWFYIWSLLVTIAAVAFAAPLFTAPLFGYSITHGTTVLTAVLIIAVAALINLSGVRRMSWVTQLGVLAEVLGTVLMGILILAIGHHNSLGIIFSTAGTGTGGYLMAFLAAALFSVWIFYGFEACGDVAEEVKDPSRKVPRAILMTIGVATLVVFWITLSMLMGVPDLKAVMSGKDADPIITIFNSTLGPIGTKAALVMVVIAFISCALAIQAATTRLLYSYGRDNMIIGSRLLSAVSERFHMPPGAVAVTGIIPIIFTLLPSNTVSRIITFAIIGIYVSFQTVVLGTLIGRLRGWKPEGSFTLGKWGPIVNALALAYGVAAIILLSYLTPAVGSSIFDRWLVPISVGIIAAAGFIYMALFRPSPSVREDAQAQVEFE